MEAPTAPASATAVFPLEGALFVELRFEATEAQPHSSEGVLPLELGHVEVWVRQIHVSANGPLSVDRGKQQQASSYRSTG